MEKDILSSAIDGGINNNKSSISKRIGLVAGATLIILSTGCSSKSSNSSNDVVVNDAPVAVSKSITYAVDEGNTKEIDLSELFIDANGDDLTFTVTSDSNSTYSINGNILTIEGSDVNGDITEEFTITAFDGVESTNASLSLITQDTTSDSLLEYTGAPATDYINDINITGSYTLTDSDNGISGTLPTSYNFDLLDENNVSYPGEMLDENSTGIYSYNIDTSGLESGKYTLKTELINPVHGGLNPQDSFQIENSFTLHKYSPVIVLSNEEFDLNTDIGTSNFTYNGDFPISGGYAGVKDREVVLYNSNSDVISVKKFDDNNESNDAYFSFGGLDSYTGHTVLFRAKVREYNYETNAFEDKIKSNNKSFITGGVPELTYNSNVITGDSITIPYGTNFVFPTATGTDNLENDLVYTIEGTVDSEKAGDYTLTYTTTLIDGTTSSYTISIVVEEYINQAPIANPDTVTTLHNTPITVDVLENDTDVEGPVSLTGTITNQVGGIFTAVNGEIEFTPTDGFSGEASADYENKDEAGLTDTAKVIINVGEYINQAPIAVNDINLTTPYDTSLLIDALGNDTDLEGNVSLTGVFTNEVGGTFSEELGKVRFTPTPGHTGAFSTSYEIVDEGGIKIFGDISGEVEAEPFVANTLPNPYDFTNIVDATLNSTVETNTITVTGINTSVTATTDLGTLVVNGVDTLTTAASVEEGDLVAVSVETGGVYSAVFSGEVVIGGGSDGFSVGVEAEPVLTPTISLDDQPVNDNGGALPTDLPAPTVTNVSAGAVYSIENDPTGGMLTIDATTGVATWLGNLDSSINYDIIIKVLNTDGTTSSTTFVLSVKNNA